MRGASTTWREGMWDPSAKNCARQWWRSGAEQSAFVNALRECLGLDPLATPKSDSAHLGRERLAAHPGTPIA